MSIALLLASSVLGLSVAGAGDSTPENNDWPGWRGPNSNGVGAGSPPTAWKEGENIRWRVAIPGKGVSSPIISGNLVIVTTAVPVGQAPTPPAEVDDDGGRAGERGGREAGGDEGDAGEGGGDARGERGAGGTFGGREGGGQEGRGARGGQDRGRFGGRGGRGGGSGRGAPVVEHEFVLMALDRKDGSVVWKVTPHKQVPHQGTHGDGSFATPTPVTDGETIFASYGSFGIYAYTMEGEEKWKTDLGDLNIQNSFGEGTSPTLCDEFLIINWDHEGDSFIAVLDKETGEEIWRKEREGGTSWSTPIVVDVEGEKQVIVTSSTTMAYELEFGDVIWELPGGRGRSGVMSSPVSADGIAYFATGDRGGAMNAVRLEDADGDLTEGDAIAWSETRDLPRIPSPIVYDGTLYALKSNSGMLSAFDAATGERKYGPERLQAMQDAYASPVAAGGHLYFAGRDGTVEVVKAGDEFETVSVNVMGEGIDASPAVAGDELYIRSATHLYCISED